MEGNRPESGTIRDRFDPRTVSLLNQIAQTQQTRPQHLRKTIGDRSRTKGETKHTSSKFLFRINSSHHQRESDKSFILTRPQSAAGGISLESNDNVRVNTPGKGALSAWQQGPRVEYQRIPPQSSNTLRRTPPAHNQYDRAEVARNRLAATRLAKGNPSRLRPASAPYVKGAEKSARRQTPAQSVPNTSTQLGSSKHWHPSPTARQHDTNSYSSTRVTLKPPKKDKTIMVSGSRTGKLNSTRPVRPYSAVQRRENTRQEVESVNWDRLPSSTGVDSQLRSARASRGGQSEVRNSANTYHESRGILFSSSLESHDTLVVFRTKEARERNPEKLCLECRNLTACPKIRGENQLRVLYLKSNCITTMSNLENLPNLMFLDLYNNQLSSIGDLSVVPNLKVLILGRNRIKVIRGLRGLKHIDVLDLHSNQISRTLGLESLRSLRILSLADNNIVNVEALSSLTSLSELNLDKNQITSVQGLFGCNLRRVFLSGNKLKSVSDLSSLYACKSLYELGVDGNPFCDDNGHQSYKQVLMNQIPSLRKLNGEHLETSTPNTEPQDHVAACNRNGAITKTLDKSPRKSSLYKLERVDNDKRETEVSKIETLDTQVEEDMCSTDEDLEQLKSGRDDGAMNQYKMSIKEDTTIIERPITATLIGKTSELSQEQQLSSKQQKTLRKLQHWWSCCEQVMQSEHSWETTSFFNTSCANSNNVNDECNLDNNQLDSAAAAGDDPSQLPQSIAQDFTDQSTRTEMNGKAVAKQDKAAATTSAVSPSPLYGVGMLTIRQHIRLFGHPLQALKDLPSGISFKNISVANLVFMPVPQIRKAVTLLHRRGVNLKALVLSHNLVTSIRQLWEVLKAIPSTVTRLWFRENNVTKVFCFQEFVIACRPALVTLNDQTITVKRRKAATEMFGGWVENETYFTTLSHTVKHNGGHQTSKATETLLQTCTQRTKLGNNFETVFTF